MRGHVFLLGLRVPGDSLVHRAPLWLKYAVLIAITAGVLATRSAWISAGSLALTVVLFASAGRRVLSMWPQPLRSLAFTTFLCVLAAHQWWLNGPGLAIAVVGGMFACIQAARLVLLTTAQGELIDALASAARVLRPFGVHPDAFALSIAVMLRSIPAVLGAVRDVSDAAAARGLRASPTLIAGPVVVATVAFAHRTGDALAARGVLEADVDPRA